MAEEKQVVSAVAAVRRGTPAVTVGLGTVVSETLSAVQAEEVKEVVETALESLVTSEATEIAAVPDPAPVEAVAPAPEPIPAIIPGKDGAAPQERQTIPASAASEAAKRLMAALASTKKKYHFVKRFTPADVITFKDGTSYTFPLIMRNDTGGFSPGSELKTNDEKLAKNLREAAKNPHLGLVEIEVK